MADQKTELRTKFLSVPLSKSEKDKITKAAKAAGLARATWARIKLLGAIEADASSPKRK